MRIITLNLNGVRSAASKGFFQWLPKQRADIVCVQELKAQAADITGEMLAPDGYHGYFHCAEKKGYSGVGIYSRCSADTALAKPSGAGGGAMARFPQTGDFVANESARPADRIMEGMGVAEIDAEGRYLRADFGELSIISLYLPSGSSGEHRQAAKFFFLEQFFPMLKQLAAAGREIVLCGDWNIAHKEIDLKNWKGNLKNSGFLPEERAWLSKVFDELGWVDVHRRLCPDATGEAYTWWSNRGQAWAKNVGWRIDYQIATPGIAQTATAASVYKTERFSDHAPLIIDYGHPF